MVVFVLLSIEYPIAEVDWPEQAEAAAIRLNGEDTWEPFAGDVTVTLEEAGAAQKISARLGTARRYFIRTLPIPRAQKRLARSLARESRRTHLSARPSFSVQIYSTRNLWIDD